VRQTVHAEKQSQSDRLNDCPSECKRILSGAGPQHRHCGQHNDPSREKQEYAD
jgi:hypothetical protein